MNIFKNKKGTAILLVVIIFAALTTFSVGLTSSVHNGVKQTVRQNNGVMATYIARSGVLAIEEAIVDLTDDELIILYEEIITGNPVGILLGNLEFEKGTITKSYIQMINEELNIKVTAESGGVTKEIVKVLGDSEELTGGGSTSSVVFDMAIFSKDKMELTNGTIRGKVGTNGNLVITGNPTIEGEGYLLDTTKYSTPGAWWNKIHGIVKLPEERVLELPLFQEFPSLPLRPNIVTAWNNSTPLISSSGYYKKIDINNWGHTLMVDTTGGNVVLVVDDLVMKGSLETIGNNKVKIYTKKSVISGQSINSKSTNKRQIEIYYDGTQDFVVGGSTQLNGSIYTNTSNIIVNGSGRVFGNIITGGNKVSVGGGTMQQDGIIYAPLAFVDITGSGTIHGAVVGRHTKVSGGALIIYTPENTDYIPIESTTEVGFVNGVRFKKGHFKGGE